MATSNSRITNILSVFLLALGCIQMIGYTLQSRNIRGLGFSYGAAPLPTVFSRVKGVEGFDTKQAILLTHANGKVDTIVIDQQLFSNFKGPFYLKESYALFLAYSHVLNPQQLESISRYMICQRKILTMFGINDSSSAVSIRIERSIYGRKDIKVLEPACQNP